MKKNKMTVLSENKNKIKVSFWGVRGSIPSPGPNTVKFGGNTSCVSIELADNKYIILDAGSGIRIFGNNLLGRGKASNNKIDLFITHTHWDHIQGLPFFATAFIKGNNIRVFGPKLFGQSLEKVISNQMEYSYFPIRLKSLGANINFIELNIGKYDNFIDDVEIETIMNNHPVIDMSYKFTFKSSGKSLAYVTDFELYNSVYLNSVKKSSKININKIGEKLYSDLCDSLSEFIYGVDLLIMDSVYLKEEYHNKIGWGHSCFEDVYNIAVESKVKKLCFFHHEPNRKDSDLSDIEKKFKDINKRQKNFESVFAAAEGMELVL
ncbi:MBL fold metallo-hydrolase [Candidatus Dependentiae bacterium]|nr:MBL fold metallo-hydrolase [Candidatus Dependentiae bacterium]